MKKLTHTSTSRLAPDCHLTYALWIAGVFAVGFGLNGCTGAALTSKPSSPDAGSLTIASDAVPAAVVQNAYNTSLVVTGGAPPYSWNLEGQLPVGLTFNAETGAIAGTPGSVGTFPIITTVRDTKADSVSRHFSLSVSPRAPRLEIASSALPAATSETNYATGLSADGGVPPYTWEITTGVLPPGVTLNASTGAITGTPTSSGTFPFVTSARDVKSAAVSAGFAIVVAAKPSTPTAPAAPTNLGPLHVTSTSLLAGTAQSTYSAQLEATGGTSPYVWSLASGTLPGGLTLNGHAGSITGTSTKAGTFPFTLSVRDSKLVSASAKFSVVIAAKPTAPTDPPSPPAPPVPTAPLKITTTALPVGTATQNYAAALAATGGTAPYVWSTSGGQLPAGLKLNASTGAITGTPTSAGNFSFSIALKDSRSASVSSTFSLNISTEPAPSIGTLSPNSTTGTGSTNVVISGNNFRSGATVQFGAASADAVQVISLTQIQVSIHSQAAGKVNVSVKNSDGQTATAKNFFTFSASPAPTPQPPASSSSGEAAQSADAFVDSTGVNIHLHFNNSPYANFPAVKTALQNLGVRHVRDGLIDTTWTTYYDELNQLGRAGIKSTLTTTTNQTAALLVSYPSRVADSFEAYESPNELDQSGNSNWASLLTNFLVTMHSAVKSNPQVSQFPILGPSLTQQSSYSQIASASSDFDDSNLHDYPGGRNPGTPGWGTGGYGSIGWNVSLTISAWLPKPVIATETGYVTDVNQTNGVPEDVAGRYMPRIFLEQWLQGVKRTFIYELLDISAPGDNNHYGLLHPDFSPKPGYTAVKNLLNLLSDPGPSFQTGNLDFTLSGNTANVHHLLLEKRDGTFYLVIWVEQPGFDVNTKQEINVPAQQVTIQTGKSVRINTHQLDITGNMATSTLGVAQSQTIQVNDQVTVLEISQ